MVSLYIVDKQRYLNVSLIDNVTAFRYLNFTMIGNVANTDIGKLQCFKYEHYLNKPLLFSFLTQLKKFKQFCNIYFGKIVCFPSHYFLF